jgi:hypothetical protein
MYLAVDGSSAMIASSRVIDSRATEELRLRLAKTIDERGRIEPETGENLATAARVRAGADTVAFRAPARTRCPRQMTCAARPA